MVNENPCMAMANEKNSWPSIIVSSNFEIMNYRFLLAYFHLVTL